MSEEKVFPGSLVGLTDVAENRNTFKQWLGGYFTDDVDADRLELVIDTNYKVELLAKKAGIRISRNDVDLDRSNVQRMLAGVIREINRIGIIRWEKICWNFAQSGVATVSVHY